MVSLILNDLSTLPEVVQQQRRKHGDKPAREDGLPAEMAHIGVKSFTAGYHQKQRTHGKKTFEWIHLKIPERPDGIHGLKHRWSLRDVHHTQNGQGSKPHDHDWTKGLTDLSGPPTLHRKQAHNDADGDGQNVRGKGLAHDA